VAAVRTYLTAVGFSPDGELITTSSEDGQIAVWRLSPFSSASPDANLTYGGDVALAFSGDSRWLLFANSNSNTVNSWDVLQGKSGISSQSLTGTIIQQLGVSRDGSLLASAGFNSSDTAGVLTIFNRATGKVEGQPWRTALRIFTALQFSPDGRTLLVCGATAHEDSLCILWDVQSHAMVESFSQVDPGQTEIVICSSFSPDGKSIGFGLLAFSGSATGGATGKIEVYSLQNRHVTATLDVGQIFPLLTSWSPDGRYVGYMDSYGDIAIWNPSSQARPIQIPKSPTGIQPIFQFVAPPPGASSKSYWLMVATEATLQLWQIDPQGQPSQYLDPLAFDNPIYSAASSPDGKYLAVGENTVGLVSVMSLDPSDWIKEACAIAGRNLTRQEWQTYVQASLPGVPYQTLCPGRPT